jgi:DNA-3-methyladenine glycosylase I
MTSAYCRHAPGHPLHGPYHDGEYGFPARDDAVLFERLVLEINQAGLSWLTILAKRAAFAEAFAGFDIDRVARFDDDDRRRLMGDARIVRNRLKIDAAIENAKRLQAVRASHGSFAAWLDAHHPLPKAAWVSLFKKTFRFTGGEIVGEFLMSLGYLPGAHEQWCPAYKKILALAPPWQRRKAAGSPKKRTVKGIVRL